MNQREHDPELIEPTQFRPPSGAPQLPRLVIPWGRLFIALVTLIGAWGAWYVVTARSVNIETNPVDATVAVDELIAPSIDGHWLLRPGPRNFVVTASGFHPFREEIVITGETLQTHKVDLKPLPGKLNIEITPDIQATVTIDDTIEVLAPALVENIEAGPREIKVRAERYLAFDTVVEMQGRGIEQDLRVALQPAWADVSIESEPAGASVSVDTQFLGTTPLESELLQGDRVINVSLDGYKPWQRSVRVTAGQALDLPPVVLAPADGYFEIATSPPGASVTVDKRYKGQSPLKIVVAPDKTHKISVVKEGYVSANRTATAASGKTEALSFTLKPELAAVQFITTPSDAELYIDKKPAGSANQTIKLPTHAHKIEIRKTGYVSYSADVTPRKGIKKRIKVRLKTPAQAAASKSAASPTAAASKGVVQTFLDQELKLFKGGLVRMGSSRREPNRRANEVLREAKLERPFYFATKEVTNAEFRRFLNNHRVAPINGADANGDQQPVVRVTWENAALFCNWLSRKDSLPVFYQIKNGKVLGINPAATGYRLPTEAEWAWVARSAPNSTESFIYPWAGKFPPRGRSGNYADQSASGILGSIIADYNDGSPITAPVGSYPASLRGIYDMGGNVAEWTNDFYTAAPASNGMQRDPLGPPSGESHVIRGSSWAHASATELRLAYRDFGKDPRDDVGFRLARYAR